MHLISNSVTANEVVEEERGGDTFLVVKDVPFVRAMHLSGGYVPQKEIKQSTNQWAGKALTVNHPRNQAGEPISVNQQPETKVGVAENPYFDGTWIRADMAVNATKAESKGGEAKDIVANIQNQDPFDVSSQYVPKELPAGNYDGEFRSNVEGIAVPDSIALLPNKQGKCSIQDGCGINPQMAANSAIRVPMTSNARHGEDMDANQMEFALSDISPADVDSYTDEEWDSGSVEANLPNPSESDENAAVLDGVYLLHPTGEEARKSKSNWKLPFRSGPDAPVNTRALVAAKTGRGIPALEGVSEADKEGARERIDSFLEAAPDELFGAAEMEDNALQKAINLVANLWSESTSDESAESDTDPTLDDPEDDSMDRDKLIGEITANSPLTESSLEERCDDGLEAIHDDVMAANDTDNMTDNDNEYVTREELESFKDDIIEGVTANQEQSEKQELAKEIVANSAEYDDAESVIDDYPTQKALETKKESLSSGGAMPGMGHTANMEFDDDSDDIGTGVMF